MGNATADNWQRLCEQFNSLAAIEFRKGLGYRALLLDCFYSDSNTAAQVGTFEHGKWALRGGVDADFVRKFSIVSIQAGMVFGATGETALNYWCHNLCLHIQREKNILHFCEGSVQIPNVCEQSASFCRWLMEEALTAPVLVPDPAENAPPLAVELGERPKPTIVTTPDRRAEQKTKRAENDKREMERLLKLPPPVSVRGHLSVLTDIETQVFTLRFGHEWKVARIARAMDRDRKTVSETIARANSKVNRRGKSTNRTATAVAHSEANDLENELIAKIDREKQGKRALD